jgi:hypothetical protein
MIVINALLLKGLKAYLIVRKSKHAIKVVMRGHSLVTLLAYPKIYAGYQFKYDSEHTCLVKMVDIIFQLEFPLDFCIMVEFLPLKILSYNFF